MVSDDDNSTFIDIDTDEIEDLASEGLSEEQIKFEMGLLSPLDTLDQQSFMEAFKKGQLIASISISRTIQRAAEEGKIGPLKIVQSQHEITPENDPENIPIGLPLPVTREILRPEGIIRYEVIHDDLSSIWEVGSDKQGRTILTLIEGHDPTIRESVLRRSRL